MASTIADQRRMIEILRILKKQYPDAHTSLQFRNPFELLISTILSAQCTDERVNRVTPALFARYPGPAALAKADLREIEKLIHATGFYHNKALSIQEASKGIVERHGGKVPRTLEELILLRGIGRKTANVVLGNAFGVPALVVDTHVGRLARRLGFTKSENPVQVERELMPVVPREDWTIFAHLLILHGRAVCTARRAFCEDCVIGQYCPRIGVTRSHGRVAAAARRS